MPEILTAPTGAVGDGTLDPGYRTDALARYDVTGDLTIVSLLASKTAVFCTPGSTNITITLPSAANSKDLQVQVHKLGSGSGTVTVQGTTLSTTGTFVTYLSDGTTWRRVGGTVGSVTAGVGLTGGGSLEGDITVSMGTPSDVSGSTTNSASGTTHSHAITDGGIDQAAIGAAAVGQGELKTSTQSLTVTQGTGTGTTTATPALTGATYCLGFMGHISLQSAGYSGGFNYTMVYTTTSDTSTCSISASHTSGSAAVTTTVTSRYVAASGEVEWVFILRDQLTKEIIATSWASDHPCFGNTEDPKKVPHPFVQDFDPKKHDLLVLNPSHQEVQSIKDLATTKEIDLVAAMQELYIIDESKEAEWPTIPVTVGLGKDFDWMKALTSKVPIKPIKQIIPKPKDVRCYALVPKNPL